MRRIRIGMLLLVLLVVLTTGCPGLVDDPSAPIITTTPVDGATDVPVTLEKIVITFNQDMNTSGRSLNWSPLSFEDCLDLDNSGFVDNRTFELTLKKDGNLLEADTEYVFTLNPGTYDNFRYSDGTPIPANTTYSFTTAAST